MDEIKFVRIDIKNFMLIDEASVGFDDGLTLVEGRNQDSPGASSNYSGKSSLWEAVIYALYGKPVRRITAREVVRIGSKACSVTLVLLVNNVSYIIHRSRTSGDPGKSTLKILRDEEEITPAKNPQDLIDKLIGMGYDAFLSTCVFSKGIQFIGLPNTEQKHVLEGLVDFTQFEKYRDTANMVVKDMQDKIEESNKAQHIEDGIITTLKEEKKQLAIWIRADKAKLDAVNPDVAVGDLEGERVEKKKRLKKVIVDLEKAGKDAGTAKYNAFEFKTTGLDVLTTQIKRYERTIPELRKEVDDPNCPTCGQPITVEEQKEKIKECVKQLEIDKVRLANTVQPHYDGLFSIYQDAQAVDRELRVEENELSNRITKIDDILATVQVPEGLKSALKQHQGRLVELEAEILEHGDQRSEIIKAVEGYEKKAGLYLFLVQAFSKNGVESYLFDSLLPFLNSRAGHYASQLSDGRIRVRFATMKESKKTVRDYFHVQVSAVEGGVSYGACSGSEERFADLAVALTLRDLASSFRPVPPVMFLDEVFDTIDEVGAERMINYLQIYATSHDSALWLISHNPILKQSFDHQITVTRSGGSSTVIQESTSS